MKNRKLSFVLVLLFVPFWFFITFAQKSNLELSNTIFKYAKFIINKDDGSVTDIQFNNGKGVSVNAFFDEYRKAFNWSEDNEAKPFQVTRDETGLIHHRFKQYYKGIELGEVQFILHEKNGKIILANGRLIHGLNLNVEPALTESEALKFALLNINAESYMWESKKNESYFKKEQNDPAASMYPKGKLILSAKNFKLKKENFRLVYRFDIYSEKPLNRYSIDVDANSGEIVNKISKIQNGDIAGQGTSVYNGVVPITIADTAISSNVPSRWHLSSWLAYDGICWWMADSLLGNQGGYDNGWYEVLDTDPILLSGLSPKLQFVHRYSVETPGGEPAGYNGWDGMNVRISVDNGATWQILQNPVPAYTKSSLYSFGEQHGEGQGIPGWAGVLNSWTNVTFDLSNFSGQTVRIRFAFASDPGLSTNDGAPELFGWQIDNISVSSSAGNLYTNFGTASGVTASNLVKEATYIPGNYRLRQYGRGGGIATYDSKNGNSFPLSTDFVDEDTNFNSANAAAGVSVHWALEKTYDYYLSAFNRNSVDNNGAKLIGYAHFSDQWFNAQWDGTRMSFGDGTNNSNPLVSIDIVAHEMTHGVTQYTANLVYLDEYGALNESFSDIFGTAVEFSALGSSANWFIGEGGVRLRSMSNPKQYGQPDTYRGQNWEFGSDDNGGVHTNSGIQNYWYYLLCEGGSGINDNSFPYSVTGIGMDAASKIAYHNLAYYLVPFSEYSDARLGSIYAAKDLYGENSIEYNSVIDAWNAVGVVKPALVPTIGIDQDSITFLAEAQFGTDTAVISISNYGLEALSINSIELNGSSFQLYLSNTLPVNLNYDESITVKVVFTPTEAGDVFGSLNINSSDQLFPNKTITLYGKGYIVNPALDGNIYAVTYQTNSSLLTLNAEEGTGNQIGFTGFTRVYGLAVKPSTGQIYGTVVTADNTPLLRIDAQFGNAYDAVILPVQNIRAIAFDLNDELFGAAYSGDLYKIDLLTGNLTFVGSTGISALSSLAINPIDGQLWATPLGGNIYKIDKTNASSILIGNTGYSQTPSIAFDSEGKFFGTTNLAPNKNSELIMIDTLNGNGTLIGSTGFPLISSIVIKGLISVGIQEHQTNIIPLNYELKQNYPNPFNASTKITYSIPQKSKVIFKIYDIIGNEINSLELGDKETGVYEMWYNGEGLTSGVYIYKIIAGDFAASRKMILLK